jgi:hypothetical protein
VCAHIVIATDESTRVPQRVPAGAADLLREGDPHPAELAHPRDQVVGEGLRPVELLGHRRDLLVGELANGLLEQAVVVGEVEEHGGQTTA